MDGTLQKVRAQVTDEEELTTEYFKRDGVIYRRWNPAGQGDKAVQDQIVVPRDYRMKIMAVAHSVPMAGHLGRKKTTRRILRRFYWPTIYRDIADFCRSCAVCQKSSHRQVPRAPMIPIPVVTEPFQRIAMDVVGPLPQNRAGNRYMLVICDYSNKYPEAVPMKSIDAEHVAEEMVKVFAKVGIPK